MVWLVQERVLVMSVKRRRFSTEFKAKVAMAALRNGASIAVIAAEYGVHPTQVREWKEQLLSRAPEVFADGRQTGAGGDEALTRQLYEEIGRLKVELDWLQRKVCL
jgi:transposase-like protein